MKYMLDTNICIYLIKKKPLNVMDKFMQIDINDISISSVTLSELAYGVEKSSMPERNRNALGLFLENIEVIDFGYEEALVYGNVRAELEKQGEPIGAYDTMIAAHALCNDLILVTNNLREFKKVKNLSLENWVD